MKNLILFLLVLCSLNAGAQSCVINGVTGYQIPVIAQVQSNGDTLCWYWNRSEVAAYVAAHGGSGSTTYLIPGDNITLDSNVDGSVKTYSVSATGGGGSCLTSCVVTTSVTVSGDGNSLAFEGFSIAGFVVGDGTTAMYASSYEGDAKVVLIVDGNAVVYADSVTSSTVVGYGATSHTYDDISGTITVSATSFVFGSTIINATLPVYADNTAALVDLVAGDLYTNGTGGVFIVYTP